MKVDLTENSESIKTIVMGFYDNIKFDKNHRFKSWEHCYNYFNGDSIEIDLACLHLSFYLASWGMYRGSSFLLQKDYKVHENAVREIVKSEYKVLRGIALQKFTSDSGSETVALLFQLIKKLNDIYDKYKPNEENKTDNDDDRSITDTLITKILLGTLGCIPAYDRFFIIGIRQSDLSYSTLNRKNFNELLDWCKNNKDEIQEISKEIKYPPMKIVDMYFWSVGEEFDSAKKVQEKKRNFKKETV